MAEKKELWTQLGIAKEDKDLRKELSFFLLKQEMILRQQYLAKSTSPMSSSSSLEDGQFYIVQLPKPVAGNVDTTMSSSRNKGNAMWRNFGMDGNNDDCNDCNGHSRDNDHDDDTRPCGKDWVDDDDNLDDDEDTSSEEDITMGGFGSDDDDFERFESSADDLHHDVNTATASDYGDFISSDYSECICSECSDDDEGSEYGDEREPEPVNPLDDEDFMHETDDDDYEVFIVGPSLTRHW